MSSDPRLRVVNAPAKPLMIFDGDCHFCRHWIERWRESTGGVVDYVSSREAAGRFPEIPQSEFDRAVQLVETDGSVFAGAEAVFCSLRYARGGAWLTWCYERVPGFAAVTEGTYRIVAQRRQLASAATRWLWGNDVRVPRYETMRSIFLRALGLIYLIAFVSLWTQIDGLIGSNGISPVGQYLSAARAHFGDEAVSYLPTLCWLNSSDAFLHLLCGVGVAVSLILIAGLCPAICLAVMFVSYLSLTIAGQTFLSFQWDILLLETGFLAIFFAPWTWRLRGNTDVPGVSLFLLKLLLFKLMFMSGVVKLTSGDESWWNLTAMRYHYQTQPLPTIFAWWAHQAPEWVGKFSTATVFAIELLVPFLIWAPRRLRLLGAAALILLQVAIAITGNYAFFNLLTIALALLLVDDATWSAVARRLKRSRGSANVDAVLPRSRVPQLQRIAATVLLLATLPVNAALIYSAFEPEASLPRPIAALQDAMARFHIVSGYGLFRVMTKTRPEIVVEGSADGVNWKAYTFRWKPGDLTRAPRWVAPHQPRLDWQMWFAALGNRPPRWFLGFSERLLLGTPAVLRLLEHNPFPNAPPRYVRATMYDYNFTTPAERRTTGAWWKRGDGREFMPAVSLRDE